MSNVSIYHNPRCSKSRCALGLLQESEHDFETIEYLKTAPSAAELNALCKQLGKEPIEIFRVKEPLFKQLGLNANDARSRSEWLDILATNPKLIERPIVIVGDKAIIARPPELLSEIL